MAKERDPDYIVRVLCFFCKCCFLLVLVFFVLIFFYGHLDDQKIVVELCCFLYMAVGGIRDDDIEKPNWLLVFKSYTVCFIIVCGCLLFSYWLNS